MIDIPDIRRPYMKDKNNIIETETINPMSPIIYEIRELLNQSRQNVALQVNQELLSIYWKVGEIIVRYEQNDQIRAAYGAGTLKQMAKVLTKELGKEFPVPIYRICVCFI